MKTMTRNMQVLASVIVSVLVFCSCDKKKSEYDFDYLAVQMSQGDSWSIIDKDGKEIVKEEYPADSKVSPIFHDVYWVKSDGKYQLFNVKDPKKPVIDEDFTSVTLFRSGVAAVSNPNQQIRIIDTEGKTVATLGKDVKTCSYISDEGYATFSNQDHKWGVIDSRGNVIIKPEYASIISVSDRIALVQRDNSDKTYLILNMKGEKQGEINMDKYELMNSGFHEGKIVVKNTGDDDGPYIILDKTGKKLFDIKKSKAKSWADIYYGEYIVFENGDFKAGVANDKGEVLIRSKYDQLFNRGDGLFYAKKGDKWGVIDVEDNTIIDFDYDDISPRMKLGDNFLMRDGNTFSLINKEGKEIVSFDSFGWEEDYQVEYIDMEVLCNSVVNMIEELEKALPISQSVQIMFKDLDIDRAHYSSGLNYTYTFDDKVSLELHLKYDNNLAEEKFHTEKEDDGWFTTEKTVSDGWYWSNAIPEEVTGTISVVEEAGISISDFYKILMAKMADGRKKQSDYKFTKTIQTIGRTLRCNTYLKMNNGENIELQILFLDR